MRFLQKLGFFCIIFLVSPVLISSSQEHVKGVHNHKDDDPKMNRKLSFEITLHGFLLWWSMGFLMPVGLLTIRMSHRVECARRLRILFYVHAIVEILSLLLSTVGAVMSFRNFNNSFNNKHQRLGVGLYGLIWLQALTGIIRPKRGSKGRSVWFLVHWMLGTAMALLGVLSIYTGLVAYHEKISKSIKPWIIMFTAEVCFIIVFYLFQDKWVYIQNQGSKKATIDQVIFPREKGKEVELEESC